MSQLILAIGSLNDSVKEIQERMEKLDQNSAQMTSMPLVQYPYQMPFQPVPKSPCVHGRFPTAGSHQSRRRFRHPRPRSPDSQGWGNGSRRHWMGGVIRIHPGQFLKLRPQSKSLYMTQPLYRSCPLFLPRIPRRINGLWKRV